MGARDESGNPSEARGGSERRDCRDRADLIEALFSRAVDLPNEARTAFLASECAGDTRLAAEVASLLAADDSARGFLDTPALAAPLASAATPHADSATDTHAPAAARASHVPDDLAGAQIGPYRILRRIGAAA